MSKFNNFELEPHEVLLDKLTREKEKEIGISEKKLEVPVSQKNLLFLLIFSFSLFFLLFLRCFYLQIMKGNEFLRKAQANRFLIRNLQAERGIIYDKNFTQLTFNIPQFDLVFKKENFPPEKEKREKILKEISQILKIDKEELKKKIENSKEEKIKIFSNLDRETLIILESKIEDLLGFEIEKKQKRSYLEGEIISHLIGYLGKIDFKEYEKEKNFYSISDEVGKEGLEKFYEKILRKNPGKLKIERNAKGEIISEEIVSLPESGRNIQLYLDFELQKKIKIELENKMKEIKAKGGAGVAIDPRTGGVLALVSLPSFDNNQPLEKYFQDPQNPLFNRAVFGQYLLGSTIKPFIALAALEEKIISPQTTIDCEGEIKIPHRYNPNKIYKFGDWAVHGKVNVKKAIAESCNVFFYSIGGGHKNQEGLGPQKIKKYLELFDFGKLPQTDFPLSESAKGFLPDPRWKKQKLGENWWDGDTYNLSIGQGYILATPFQVAKAFTAIANGGKLLKPKFVWKILDKEKNTLEEFKPEIERENFLDPKNLEIVKEGMKWAVTGENSPLASAILLRNLPVTAAAKTGTAQVFRKGCENCYNVWIATFAPFENPEIVLVLVLEDVPGKISQVVVPVAKEILNWYFSR